MILRLRTQYTLAIASVVVLTALALAAVIVYSSSRAAILRTETISRAASERLISEMRNRAELASHLVAENIVNAYYMYDMERMDNVLSAAMSQPNLVTAEVFDLEGRIVHDGTGSAAYGDRGVGSELLAALTISRSGDAIVRMSEDAVYATTPLLMGDDVIGGTTVALSLAELKQQIILLEAEFDTLNRQAVRHGVFAIVLAAALIVGVAALIASRVAARLSRPITNLSRAALEIGKGLPTMHVEAQGAREIVDLVDSFNSMARDLSNTTISLDRLEDVVAERTSQIRAANQRLRSEIGHRKRAEEELQRHRDRLELLVVERTQELTESNCLLKREIKERIEAERSRQQLEAQLLRAKKMESLGMLAGGVAHDLNNILTGIVSYPELLLHQIPPDSKLAEPLRTIMSSGERAAAVVQDLLTMARRGVASMEPRDLNAIVDEYLMTPEFKSLAAARPDVDVQVRRSDQSQWIMGSRVHLIKSIANLVMNAFEAMPDRGTVRIETRRAEAGGSADRSDVSPHAVLEISDTGIGISHDDLERIFEPFYTKKKLGRSGSGLGMAVVWGTVQDHDGRIDVDSRLSEGTTFTVFFPVTDLPPEQLQDSETISDFEGRGQPILVVDDVAEQRDVATKMLTMMGYEPTAVSGGEEAIDYVRDHECDLLVLDMIMDPGIDGLETYRRILDVRPDIRVVIASGFAESERVAQARALGASFYIQKPYSATDLGRAVSAALQ